MTGNSDYHFVLLRDASPLLWILHEAFFSSSNIGMIGILDHQVLQYYRVLDEAVVYTG
jgi:hypothetical protein